MWRGRCGSGTGPPLLKIGGRQQTSFGDFRRPAARVHGAARARPLRRCLFDRADQQICDKGLMQIGGATRTLSLYSRGRVVKSSHENNRKLAAGYRQMPPQLDSGHATEMDVEEQAIDVCRPIEAEECLGGGKDFRGKSICAK